MRIEIVKNFITEAEIQQLNAWAVEGVEKKWLDVGISGNNIAYTKRLTSRLYRNRFTYPDIVRTVSEKVRKFVGIDAYPLIEGHGRDGVVVSYTYPEGDVYRHKDPKGPNNLATLRCNILTQKADSGCQLYVDGTPVNFDVGDLHCYLVSEHEHWATKVEGNTPRIMWMFGAHVPAEDWNSGKIKVNNGLS